MNGEAIEIGVQLAVSAGLVLLMTIIHGLGLLGITKVLRLKKDRLEQHSLDVKALMLLGALGMALFALHTIEIWAFAIFYLAVGAHPVAQRRTLLFRVGLRHPRPAGRVLSGLLAVIGALEALVGFVLIGWSTAFMVATMNRLRRSP